MSEIENLPKVYDPKGVESKWYKYWLEKDYFKAEVDHSKPKYSITIPPPNVTGSLHIGHALCYSIQDVLIRWKRMQGFSALCLPGTDHAGIATQNKVEQQIAEEGLTRHDLGREDFLKKVWAWKENYGGQILHQFKTMGFSFDWERERFTMDAKYSDAVLESFVRLFNKGYIYKGARVINWCPRCHTAISDIEVEHIEHNSHMWHFKYSLEEGNGHIIVATTRPETMLGDTAVAVNPKDSRYTHLIGKNVKLPLTGRLIPIVADEYVDMEFGTGAVKVTPAHDPNDFEIGLRHNLPQVVVIAPNGAMAADAGEKYCGLDRYEARKEVVKDLQKLGLLEKIDDHIHQVGTCERCHTVIEPLLSEQWFCKMRELAKPAIDAVTSGRINFHPQRYERIYLDWMENVKDWCISRQLWWGHRIPVWKCEDCGQFTASKDKDVVCSLCGSSNCEQDPDVLDTWFSSALWPFATMGWPEKTKELDYFYPTDVLVTAREIIYLWVARMIFSSMEYLDGEIPFKDVYIYATVLNEEGRRMSKSLGTGVDPLGLIEEYGVDALRFSLIAQAGKNQDLRFSDKKVEQARNFANKIWNASRFVMMNLADFDSSIKIDETRLEIEDKWLLSRLQSAIKAVNDGFEGFDMDDASKAIYEFIWNEYCDWYLEIAKSRFNDTDDRANVQAVLYYALETLLRLLHPIMPFITEEIWQALPHSGKSIMTAEFPEVNPDYVDIKSENQMSFIMEIVRGVRNLRADLGVSPGKAVNAVICANQDVLLKVSKHTDKINHLGKITSLALLKEIEESKKMDFVSTHISGLDIYVEVAGLIDVDKEIAKIDNELNSIEKELLRTNGKLNNQAFIAKAPAEIIDKEKRIAQELNEKKTALEERKRILSDS